MLTKDELMKKFASALAGGALAVATMATGALAQQTEVTIGYQAIYNPWKVAIADGAFEEATGAKIKWVKFDSGSKAIAGLASGSVDIALAGSSPIAAGVSRDLPIQLFWITENINDAEALVVRDGAGIAKPEDLIGKRIGVPFVSTTHFHTLFALQTWGIDPTKVELLNLQPNAIAAAWQRGDIDAAFVWDPALGQIKQSGEVLITSGELAELGKATFDGLVVRTEFAEQNEAFLCGFVQTIAAADADWRDNPDTYGPESEKARKITTIAGGDPAQVAEVLALYDFPTLEQQASDAWLGGGVAVALEATSEFLKEQKQIDALLPDYGTAVNASFVEAALAGCKG
jgi:taurine transport system substrate-binding protein